MTAATAEPANAHERIALTQSRKGVIAPLFSNDIRA